jgi:folate-dependent phosphoribosylglycinamide formyltransferase PurN
MGSTITESVFELYADRPTAVILMSGQGSNAEAILANEEIRDLYDFQVIATDNPDSNASALAETHGLQLLTQHAPRFADAGERRKYFDELSSKLVVRGVRAAIYGGFMKITAPMFCDDFPGVNVHPADLTVLDSDGIAKYRGMRALANMRGELGYVRSTVHIVDNPVDSGSAIALSDPVHADSDVPDHEVHQLLKEKEHHVYTRTLILLGRGALSVNNIPYNTSELEKAYHDR